LRKSAPFAQKIPATNVCGTLVRREIHVEYLPFSDDLTSCRRQTWTSHRHQNSTSIRRRVSTYSGWSHRHQCYVLKSTSKFDGFRLIPVNYAI